MNNIGIRKTIHAHNATSKEKRYSCENDSGGIQVNQSNVETKKEKKGIMKTFHNPKNDIYHNYNN